MGLTRSNATDWIVRLIFKEQFKWCEVNVLEWCKQKLSTSLFIWLYNIILKLFEKWWKQIRDTLRENIKISNIPPRLLLVVRFRDQYLQVPWPPTGLNQLCPLPELRSGVMQFQDHQMKFHVKFLQCNQKVMVTPST